MSDETVVLKNANLKALIKAFSGKLPVARVGIMGSNSIRRNGVEGPHAAIGRRVEITNENKARYAASPEIKGNATIGAMHEFGTSKLPVRSFLRMPITEKLDEYLNRSGAFDKKALARVIKEGSIATWIDKVGAMAYTIVADAFNSEGFGKWPKSDMTQKENWQTLVETHQLRDSITYEVKE